MPRRFTYKMQNILDVRDTSKKAREMDLMRANAKLRSCHEALEETRKEIRRAQNLRIDDSGLPPAQFLSQREAYLGRMRRVEMDRENEVRMAQVEVERRRKELVEANMELKKMERNRELEKVRWGKRMDDDEQKFNDEVSGVIDYYKKTEEP